MATLNTKTFSLINKTGKTFSLTNKSGKTFSIMINNFYHYFLLSDYDSLTLGYLDPFTLEELDYEIL